MRLLEQEAVLENPIVTGLRGVGKTVLLDSLKPKALERRWIWVGTDLSESASVSEYAMAVRLITDLSLVTSDVVVREQAIEVPGFARGAENAPVKLNYKFLMALYEATPGLVSDKLKGVLEFVWPYISQLGFRGLIFAYDEAQTIADQAAKEEYPMSLLLYVFQSLQKKGLPILLCLTGLPTLLPKLVEARTFAERMFHVILLGRLSSDACRQAILLPIEKAGAPITLTPESVDSIIDMSGGYPYFIQFICREVFDAFIVKHEKGETPSIPAEEIMRKLDEDFFAGRWARATDRQRDLLMVIAQLPNCDDEFAVRDVVSLSEIVLPKPFGSSQVNQMLAVLASTGLVFKNRHGRYSFAVPLLGDFIMRQMEEQRGGQMKLGLS